MYWTNDASQSYARFHINNGDGMENAYGYIQVFSDPLCRTTPDLSHNRIKLISVIAEAMLARAMKERIKLLTARSALCGPIHDMAQALKDPQGRRRGDAA